MRRRTAGPLRRRGHPACRPKRHLPANPAATRHGRTRHRIVAPVLEAPSSGHCGMPRVHVLRGSRRPSGSRFPPLAGARRVDVSQRIASTLQPLPSQSSSQSPGPSGPAALSAPPRHDPVGGVSSDEKTLLALGEHHSGAIGGACVELHHLIGGNMLTVFPATLSW